jgi:hypothetical protein
MDAISRTTRIKTILNFSVGTGKHFIGNALCNLAIITQLIHILHNVGPFENFVDSHYYSESELCEGAVTVSFSNKVSPRTSQTALVVAPPS